MDTTTRAILLDFDGTLVDSEPLHYNCWLETVRPHGASISWTDYHSRMVGVSDRECGRILLRDAGHSPSDELADELCAAKKRLYRERFCQELTIAAELLEAVAACNRALPVGIVSSSFTNEVEPFTSRA